MQKVIKNAALAAFALFTLACAGCASGPTPEEKLREAVVQPCVVDGVMPFNAPYDRCDAINALVAGKKVTTTDTPKTVDEALIGPQKTESVDCVLPSGREVHMPYDECRHQGGVILDHDKTASNCLPFNGKMVCGEQSPVNGRTLISPDVQPLAPAMASATPAFTKICDQYGQNCHAYPPQQATYQGGYGNPTQMDSYQFGFGNGPRGKWSSFWTQSVRIR